MIGLLGGTFDPIHYGHLRPAQEVYRRLGLERLHVIPSATPPHRDPPIATAAQRLEMVKLAVAEFPGFVADDRELRRGGISYSVDTLAEMRQEIGDAPLCFLLGADAFAGLSRWHRSEALCGLAHLIVVQRPGTGPVVPVWAGAHVCADPKELATRPAGGLMFIPVAPQHISATELRAAIARGETPGSDRLSAAVFQYIHRHNIYRSISA